MDARNPTLVSGAGLNLSGWDGQCCPAEHDSAVRVGRTDCPAEHDRGPRAQFSILCLVSSCLLPSILPRGELHTAPFAAAGRCPKRRGLGAITIGAAIFGRTAELRSPPMTILENRRQLTLCRAYQCFLKGSGRERPRCGCGRFLASPAWLPGGHLASCPDAQRRWLGFGTAGASLGKRAVNRQGL